MMIIGCDYHPGFQQIAFVDTETGELQERRLEHREEAEKFYRDLAAQGMKVRVGMEASGHARWFERLLSELQCELWIGDAAEISARRVRKQKTDAPGAGESRVELRFREGDDARRTSTAHPGGDRRVYAGVFGRCEWHDAWGACR
jgi:hypothetical protein